MNEEEKIYLASKAAEKGWTYEELRYGDDLYGKENLVDDVWEYVTQYKDNGHNWFYDFYGAECKLY